MKKISILGSTGSIGTQTLDVLQHHPELGRVSALVAHRNVETLAHQAQVFQPEVLGIVDEELYIPLREAVAHLPCEVVTGPEALQVAATHPDVDVVVTAVVGAAGLAPTLAAVQEGKTIALANKETLVAGGALVTQAMKQSGALLLPVDSEHSALFQCMQGQRREDIASLVLTASGGPLRNWNSEDIVKATAADCLAHPTWSMGAKITIDSATLFNKGLEVIEAHWLFDFAYDDIEVVVHPQSIVHSLLRMRDGAYLAQMGAPDMREPIQYALSYPRRLPLVGRHLDLLAGHTLTFERPRIEDFPALQLAYEVGRAGSAYPAIFNAANEVCVESFLKGAISFGAIYHTVRKVVDTISVVSANSLEDILEADGAARRLAASYISAS